MIRQITCVAIDCDTCDEAWDEGIPLWENRDQAVTTLADEGWRFSGEDVICPHCWAGFECAELGHEFLPAVECHCGGRYPVPGHENNHENGRPSYRTCARCYHTELAD